MSAYETLKGLQDRVVGKGPWRLRTDWNVKIEYVEGTIGAASLSTYPELIELIPELLLEYERLQQVIYEEAYDDGFSAGSDRRGD